MKDYTTNNCCNFLWISDLLQLNKSENNVYIKVFPLNEKSTVISVNHVVIFGTVIEVKEINKGYLYQIDDGTGVITCKHNEQQFAELMSVIESEQADSLNDTEFQKNSEQSFLTDTSADDSIFNDKSIQVDEIILNKKGRLKGLQSIWDDLYVSFHSLIQEYNIGDSVVIQGRLYSFFNTNQIYINTIRTIDISEEIMLLRIKLEDNPNESQTTKESEEKSGEGKRFSGLVTFDNIQELSPGYSVPRNIGTPDVKEKVINEVKILTPNLETAVTFDTFTCEV